MPEAIYCEGKTTEQCVQAVSEMLHNERFTDAIIATRANPEQYSALLELDPTQRMDRRFHGDIAQLTILLSVSSPRAPQIYP